MEDPPPLEPPRRQAAHERDACRLSPRALSLLALAGLIAGFVWTLYAGAHPLAWYPRCPLFSLTGLFCPGCGSARTLHAIAHGDICAAATQNILLTALLPLIALWASISLYRGIIQNRPPLPLPTRTACVALVLLTLFGILRNLPWEPFSLLAPG
jgi:hypothetical protein